MTNQEITEKVNTFLIDRLEIGEDLIKPESNLRADLGLTSLDMQEMMMFCKSTFGFIPVRRDLFSLNTLNDVYSLIEQKQR